MLALEPELPHFLARWPSAPGPSRVGAREEVTIFYNLAMACPLIPGLYSLRFQQVIAFSPV